MGGVSLDGVFTSTGESGIVECFSVRSGGCHHDHVILLLKHLRVFLVPQFYERFIFFTSKVRNPTSSINKIGLSTEA